MTGATSATVELSDWLHQNHHNKWVCSQASNFVIQDQISNRFDSFDMYFLECCLKQNINQLPSNSWNWIFSAYKIIRHWPPIFPDKGNSPFLLMVQNSGSPVDMENHPCLGSLDSCRISEIQFNQKERDFICRLLDRKNSLSNLCSTGAANRRRSCLWNFFWFRQGALEATKQKHVRSVIGQGCLNGLHLW